MGAWITVTRSKGRVLIGLLITLGGIYVMFRSFGIEGEGFSWEGFMIALVIMIIGLFIAKSGQYKYWNPNVSQPP